MNGTRRLYLDRSPGEVRGVVTLDGQPERLLIERGLDIPGQRLGSRLVARVARIERGLATAFLSVPEGEDLALGLSGDLPAPTEGAFVEVEISAESRDGKGAVVRFTGLSDGPARLVSAGPALADRLQAFAPDAPILEGADARQAADLAQDSALATVHAMPGGGTIAIETTRALTAIDVDVGARGGGDAKRVARQANLAAISQAARLLRLKGIGGLVVIDLAGKGHDGPALSAAAKAAFSPDGSQVSIGPISRFGLFELALPRQQRPVLETLCGGSLHPTALTTALIMLRAIEREGRANPGARLEARCSEAVGQAAAPYTGQLVERVGPRFVIAADLPVDARFEVTAL